MARYKVTLEYAGTRYSGWQKQKNARTVQGEIERAIAEVTGQRTFEFQGSGRTDAGVHALHQVAHLDINLRMPPETLRRQVNDELPADINLLRVDPAPARFTPGTRPWRAATCTR
jgi:tRNA pseudouridine38-40 synthase